MVKTWILIPLLSILVGTLAIFFPIYTQYNSLSPNQPFAFITNNTIINYPAAYHSRYRGLEYQQYDRFFFQWWNYLIVDSITGDHWNIIYQLTNYSSTLSKNTIANTDTIISDEGYIGMIHGLNSLMIVGARDSIALDKVQISNDFDIIIDKPTINGYYSMKVLDSNTYQLLAKFPSQTNTKSIPIQFNLTFYRHHGVYGGIMAESGNKDFCTIVSYLFGYNSAVAGTITEGEKSYQITNTNRYRAYAAGSYGCQLPNGNPAAEYPWTWFWLSIPANTMNNNPELGIVMGTAKFQTGFPLGDLYGGFAVIGLDEELLSAQFAKLRYNTSTEIPLQSTASDQYLQSYTVETDNWVQYTDPYGTAQIPLIQIYTVNTANYYISIRFNSSLSQYFRAPVSIELHSKLRVFSDFRAVNVEANIEIIHRPPTSVESTVIFSGTVNNLNALEYAYESDINMELFKLSTQRK